VNGTLGIIASIGLFLVFREPRVARVAKGAVCARCRCEFEPQAQHLRLSPGFIPNLLVPLTVTGQMVTFLLH
jgi:hypothetical protein